MVNIVIFYNAWKDSLLSIEFNKSLVKQRKKIGKKYLDQLGIILGAVVEGMVGGLNTIFLNKNSVILFEQRCKNVKFQFHHRQNISSNIFLSSADQMRQTWPNDKNLRYFIRLRNYAAIKILFDYKKMSNFL